MLSAKSNEQASKYRAEGDEFLEERKFYEALVAFNKCLSHAEQGSVELALGFESRSRVYYAIEQLEKCLRNVKFAKDFNFPDVKLLDEREEICEKFLSGTVIDPSEDLLGFFQLSIPANEKIPFIAECLEIHENEQYGRYVITTKDLSPGDVVAIEVPNFNFICPSSIYTNCFNCLGTNMLDLIPSSTSVMFCSEKCLAEGYLKFNNRDALIVDSLCGNDIRQKMMRIMSDSLNAAGSFEELLEIAERPGDKSVFDFDFSDPNDNETRKKLLICARSFSPKTDSGIVVGYLKNILNLPEGPKKDFFVKFIAKIILSYMRNGVKLPGRGTNTAVGGMILPFVALLNHSCDPNIYASFVNSKCHLIVTKPVKSNEQIFVNYRKTFMEQPKETRQLELLKFYEFKCECDACTLNFPMPNKLQRIDKSFTLPAFGVFGSNKEVLTELKANFSFIDSNHVNHPCFETAAVLMRNKELLRTISERASFPFELIK